MEDETNNEDYLENLIFDVPIKGDKGDPGKDGRDGIDGKDGKDGIDGKTPSKKELTGLIIPLIPDPIHGKDGKDGSPDKPLQIAEKLNTLKEAIDISVIKGGVAQSDLISGMAKIDGRMKLIDQRWHGAGSGSTANVGKVKIDGADTTADYLATKLLAGSNINLTVGNVGGNETLTIDSTSVATNPGGSDTYVQYNDGGVFGGDANFTWDKTTQLLTVTGAATVTGVLTLTRSNFTTSSGNQVWTNTLAGWSLYMVGATSSSGGTAGNSYILGGDAFDGTSTAGNVVIDAGSPGAGSQGQIFIGPQNASRINIEPNIYGGVVSGVFKIEGATTGSGVGASLRLFGGQGTGGQVCGDVVIDSDDSTNQGTPGTVYIGNSYATSVNIGGAFNYLTTDDGGGNLGIGANASMQFDAGVQFLFTAPNAQFTGTTTLNSLTYTWPAAHAVGALVNNGAGVLSWATGNVTSVSNSDGTLTISPTNGDVVASLALGHANTWTAAQKINVNSTSAFFVEQDGVNDNVFMVDTTNARVAVNLSPSSAFTFDLRSPSASSDVPGRFEKQTTATTLTQSIVQFKATSTGSSSDGFGPYASWVLRDSSNTDNILGKIAYVRAGADNTGDLWISNNVAGTENWNFGMRSTGQIYISQGPLASAPVTSFPGNYGARTINILAQDAGTNAVGIDIRYAQSGGGTTTRPVFLTSLSTGSFGSPGVLANATEFYLQVHGGYGSAQAQTGALWRYVTTQAWSGTQRGTKVTLEVTASGATTQNVVMTATGAGVAMGNITPTALLHLAAGTATASTAPLKFNSGTSLTTAEAGAMEFTTDDLFFTITTGAARKNVTLWDTLGTSGRVPIVSTNGRLIDDADMTFATDTLTVTKIVGSTSITSPLYVATGPVRLKAYTVATLPGGTVGDTAYVTDALAPTFLAAIVGGGAVVTPVFYNGTAWVSY